MALKNIIKDSLQRGEYVGHAGGNIWQIIKTSRSDGNYAAYPKLGTIQERNVAIMGWTLAELDAKLGNLSCK